VSGLNVLGGSLLVTVTLFDITSAAVANITLPRSDLPIAAVGGRRGD
jgi:hypothetical protein